jgi:predicted dehydrogenase
MRLVVLGCGSIGRRHLQNLQSLGYTELLAYDPASRARRMTREETGLPSLSSLDEVWAKSPEVALVTAGTQAHVDLGLEAARHGCHLFIEKPLSHSIDGRLHQLLSEIEKRKLITMVACNMRYHPGPMAVKELLESGSVGEIIAARIQAGSYLPRWHPNQEYQQSYSASPEWGGAVLDCIHEIDLALWYFGPAKLAGAACLGAGTIGLESDGLAEILLRHKSGVLSSLHLNFVQRDYKRSCQIIGSRGTIYWDFNERQVNVFGEDGELVDRQREPEGWQSNQMYVEELKDFLRSVETLSPTANAISRSLEALDIALAVRSTEAKSS